LGDLCAPLGIRNEFLETGRKRGVITRRKQKSRLAIANQFPVAANIRRQYGFGLSHRFQWLQRRHKISEPHAPARKYKNVDQPVVARNLAVVYAAGEMNTLFQMIFAGQPPQACFVRTTAHKQHRKTRLTFM
jgi:hypothetical protein